jgi:hypothetical protein
VSPKHAKRFVVDASVARAAGDKTAENPLAKDCFELFETIRSDEYDYAVVMTVEIRAEWEKHQSRYAFRWIANMKARKKLYTPPDDVLNTQLRDQVDKEAKTDKHRAAMLKDVHLIEAALATDNIVFSLDDVVRKLFRAIAAQVILLKQIMWSNPSKLDEACKNWLENGAIRDPKRCLEFVEKD